jgi:hypothetical protein
MTGLDTPDMLGLAQMISVVMIGLDWHNWLVFETD